MKILHLISGGDSGGAKTALFSLFSHPVDGVYNRVACLTDGVFYRELDKIGTDKVLFRQKSRFDLSVADAIADALANEGFDLLHAHGARANFIAAIVKKRVSVPVVTTIHSDYLRDFDAPIKKLVFTPLNVLSLRKIKYHIAVSKEFETMLIRRGFSPNTIFTVYNGFDVSDLQNTCDRNSCDRNSCDRKNFFARHGLEIPDSATVFGCVARLDRVKGADKLLRAAARVKVEQPTVYFLIAGDGGEKKRLFALSRRLGLTENVRFLGHISDISSFYSAIDAVVIPSRSESFPYSMLESAAHSLPIIAAEVGGIPEFVVHEKTGLLFPREDVGALAESILRFVRSSADERLALGKAANELLLSDFSADRPAREYAKIYSSIVSAEKAHAADKKDCDFALSGYYGYGNIGDEAVLRSIIARIRENCPDASFTVLSRHPKRTRLSFKVNSRFRYGTPLTSALKSSRVLLSGGGTLMQDGTSSRSLRYYLYVIKKAKKLGLSVMQYANGFGPVENEKNLKNIVQTVNKYVDVVTARDGDSFAEMMRSGIKSRTILSADPTIFCEKNEGLSARPDRYIAVAVREIDNRDDFADAIICAVRKLCKTHNMRAVFVVMHGGKDSKIAKLCAARLGGEVICPETVDEARACLENASLVIAARLHAVIFAVCSEVPVVAVAYDKKVSGFMHDAGLTTVINADEITADGIVFAAEKAFCQGTSPRLSELSRLADVSRDEAVQLLKKQKSET